MSNRPLLLDLYCGAGGAAMGYYRAGFDVLGVDIRDQPRYPFDFVQSDALEWLDGGIPSVITAIHASPPCQDHSRLAALLGALDDARNDARETTTDHILSEYGYEVEVVLGILDRYNVRFPGRTRGERDAVRSSLAIHIAGYYTGCLNRASRRLRGRHYARRQRSSTAICLMRGRRWLSRSGTSRGSRPNKRTDTR